MEFEPNNVFSVQQDSFCYMQRGWITGFHFGHGCDAIEEDALNEKYCIEVLRILIAKTETEIYELEKDLVFLQNELAWAEYDDWSEKCCNALTKKLDCLSIMVWSLKNIDKNDFEVHLLMQRQPAKRLHEILKALLNDYFQEKDKENEQPLDVAVLDSSDPPGHAAEFLDDSKKLSKSDSYVTVKEEFQESSITPTENGATLGASLMLQEKKAKHSETVKLSIVNAEDSNSNHVSLKLEADHADDKKVLSSVDLKSANKGKTKEPAFTSKDKKVVQIVSLKTTDKRHNLDMIELQPTDVLFKYSCRNALKNTTSHSNKNKSLSTFDQKITSEEAEENTSTSVADIFCLDSSLKPWGKSENLGIKLVNAVVKDSDSNACRHETDIDKEMTTKWKSNLKIGRNEEVRINHTIGGNKILEASSNPEGKGNHPKADKPTHATLQNICDDALSHASGLSLRRNNTDSRFATSRQTRGGNSDASFDALKHMPGFCGSRNNSDSRLAVARKETCGNFDVNPVALQHATDPGKRSNSDSALATFSRLKVGNCDVSPAAGLNQRRYHSDSNLNAFRLAKGGYCDVNQKLCDFAQKATRKRRIKESNLTLTGMIDSSPSASSSGAQRNGKNFLKIVKFEKASLTDDEHSGLTFLLQQASPTDNEHSGLRSLLELQDEETMQSEESQVDEIATNDEMLNLDSVQPHKQKAERKIESNSPSVQEPGSLSIEMVSNSSLISKAKRQWKSGLGCYNTRSNQSLDREMTKKIFYNHQNEPIESSGALDDSQISVSQPKKKLKKNLSLPILVEIKGSTIETDLSKSHRDLNARAGKDDLSIAVSHSIDSCSEAMTCSPYAASHLRNMKLGDLRTIAKEQKLRKYSKLRKDDLIEQIANKLGCC